MGMLFVLIFWAIVFVVLSLIRTDNVTFLLLPLQKAKEEKDGSIIPHTRSIYWDIRCK